MLPAEQADAGTEADVWQHSALGSDSAAAASLIPEQAQALRQSLARDDSEEAKALRRRLIREIKKWRGGGLPVEIWFDELLNFDPDALQPDGDGGLGEDLDDAQRYFAEFCDENPDPDAPTLPGHDRAWVARVKARSTEYIWNDGKIGQRLAELAVALDPNGVLPPGVSARHIPHRGKPERKAHLSQAGSGLVLTPDGVGRSGAGSPWATLHTRNGLIEIKPLEPDEFWKTACR